MNDKPRYSRISDILDLAVFMSSKLQGITIKDIEERYNVSRRTAERMRDSLTCIFPSIEEIETDDIQKHWGFVNYSISNLITFDIKEIGKIAVTDFVENNIYKDNNYELARSNFDLKIQIEKWKKIFEEI